jgi:hypothetical protein
LAAIARPREIDSEQALAPALQAATSATSGPGPCGSCPGRIAWGSILPLCEGGVLRAPLHNAPLRPRKGPPGLALWRRTVVQSRAAILHNGPTVLILAVPGVWSGGLCSWVEGGEWRVEGGESGEWRVEGAGWRVEGGGWSVTLAKTRCPSSARRSTSSQDDIHDRCARPCVCMSRCGMESIMGVRALAGLDPEPP